MLWSRHWSNNVYAASHYRAEIDGLRAIAVATVIANHFNKEWFPGGYLGVDVFFVISGYVITGSLLTKQHHSFLSLLETFYARRFKRLLPALAVCVVLTCIAGALFINHASSDLRVTLKTAAFAIFGLSNFFLLYNDVDYFGSSADLNLFTHTWSLGVEEQFYFIYPAILWLSTSRQGIQHRLRTLFASITLLSVLSFLCFAWMVMSSPRGAYYLMPPRFWELGIGCLAFLGHQSIASRWKRSAGPISLIALGGLLATVFVSGPAFLPPVTAVASTTLLIFFMRPGNPAFNILTLRPMIFVGTISYSLYLWHWPVIALSRYTIGFSIWTLPIQLAAIATLSLISFLAIESPLRRNPWFGSSTRTVLTSFVTITAVLIAIVFISRKDLYLGKPAELAEKGVNTLIKVRKLSGKDVWDAPECIMSSDNDVGKRIVAQACTINDNIGSGRRLLVIGNSFSAAEFDMFAGAPETGLGSVTITSSWGASPVPEIPNNSNWAGANSYYWGSVIPQLVAELKPGDIVVMVNDIAELQPQTMTRADVHVLEALGSGLSHIAKEMDARGVAVVFQTIHSFIRDAECTPDMAAPQWFKAEGQSGCKYYSRDYTLKRRSALQNVLLDIQARHHNFYVLDLIEVFCPGEVCTFTGRKGEFLYRDEWSHPSVEANYSARPVFLSLIKRIGRDANSWQPHLYSMVADQP